MNKSIRNRLHMYRAVKQVLADHQAAWSNIPAFAEAYTAFTDRVTELEQQGIAQQTITIGVSQEQREAKKAAIEVILTVAKIIRAYALDNDLVILAASMNVSKSGLVYGNLETRLQIMNRVLDASIEYGSELGNYGLDQAALADAQTSFLAYYAISEGPRSAIIQRKQITESIKILAKEIDAILKNSLDAMMLTFSQSAPVFLKHYFDARIVIAYGSSTSTTGQESDPGSEGSTQNAA